MLPTIPPNCKLLVQSKASLEKGMPIEEQICVIRIDDIYIRRLQKLPKYKLWWYSARWWKLWDFRYCSRFISKDDLILFIIFVHKSYYHIP